MATGLGSIMHIGKSGLFASQAALQTVGNNISNVNTTGYSRQAVRFEAYPALDYFPGQMGQGVNAAEVTRYFDKFVERQFLQKNSDATRWSTMYANLSTVEGVFNESYGYGIGSLLSNFFAGWEKLSQSPDDLAIRQALLASTDTLTESIQYANNSLQQAVVRAETEVTEQVERANTLMRTIAELNKQISMHYVEARNNPNSLLDERDALVRELGALIDVDVIDNGGGHYIVNMKGGQTLVDGGMAYELSWRGAQSAYTAAQGGTFDGKVEFDGADGYEYTVEIVDGGSVGAPLPPATQQATFRVSLDGGQTWITDGQGREMLFDVNDAARGVRVKDLEISFDPGSGNELIAGDRFSIVPKSGLYWIEPTQGPMLVSPQEFASGLDNRLRATGGAIGGNLFFIDYEVREIQDQLDEFSKNLIWEVNRIHTQGTGLQKLNSLLGDYRVKDVNYPLDSLYNRMPWSDRLQAGSFSLALYDTATGNPIMIEPGMTSAIDINFSPDMSLQDLVTQMNAITISGSDSNGNVYTNEPIGTFLNIGISDNRLSIGSADAAFEFGFGDDTTGLLAALGLNTFFQGDGASNIAVNTEISTNHNFLNTSAIDGAGASQSGDNLIAKEIAGLVNKRLTFTDWTGRSVTQTITDYYATIVSSVGSKTLNANFQSKSKAAQAQVLSDTQDSIAGVNLDEEMTSLIRFQASYKAAAKLITTADEMFQTVLAMKN